MELTRRHLAAAGVLALGASTLIRPALADAGDEGAVKEATELLRKALLAQDKAKLEALIAEQVSYGHSDGRVQDKAEFVDGTMTRKATVKSLDFPELKVAVVGDAAIARHLWLSESELDGKPTNTKIGVLAVWQKQDGSWRVVARQGYKLA
jgi:ketosteroid isomerase-like protein